MKPQLWVIFAAAAATDIRTQAVEAAEKADKLLYQFELRFPVKPEESEPL
jgi:hypothetical protein